ncbi:sigma-70 family RNA polymerase sigma factor [Actinoalloteichus hymeniacidonis]|uniref:RNA polymerase sigma factor n=1 Tax=Actinoalloteichus hymeniacidonis TaxID=340345 RepID=A0AAC9HTI0_9PSEU|nr:sigma-70 family RNA polymerase sigma factor [Actinoalloteichus hymeniacidonis]AOS64841.1 RNA polymerase sigma factor, sigma-70 family [Actinoalloteichus hymeniacidonis]MBB5907084.1 RNA polymerase sigma-70 factor (ECF subfamily) [Actinoalloteichus hymeniacidonis]
MTEEQVTALALAAGRGDRAALEAWVRATQRDVWRFLAHLADPGSADDLTQETYLRAFSSLPRFAARSSARTWLISIARRVVVDKIRSQTARPRLAREVDWQQAAEADAARRHQKAAGFEDIVELNMLLDALDESRRSAIVLTQILGLSYAEAADVCECEIGTIRSRVARAREDLLRARERAQDTG